jgi:hypothetical protein
VRFLRWCAGFVETNAPQSITYLIALIVGCALAFLVVVFALDLLKISFGVAGVIASVIVAMGGVINILLRKGDDTRPPGGAG